MKPSPGRGRYARLRRLVSESFVPDEKVVMTDGRELKSVVNSSKPGHVFLYHIYREMIGVERCFQVSCCCRCRRCPVFDLSLRPRQTDNKAKGLTLIDLNCSKQADAESSVALPQVELGRGGGVAWHCVSGFGMDAGTRGSSARPTD